MQTDFSNMTQEEKDLYFMARAITLAKEAATLDEVPVGAVLTVGDRIVAEGINYRENGKCATFHAELRAIEAACKHLGGWRLPSSTLYVTLEPCAMCAGAIVNARVERVVFGATDHRFGALGGLFDLNAQPLNHHPRVTGGVMGESCGKILSEYFKAKRAK